MGTGIKAGQTRKVIILITIVPFMGTGIKAHLPVNINMIDSLIVPFTGTGIKAFREVI